MCYFQTPEEFDAIYDERLKIDRSFTTNRVISGISHDAVWTLALALNKTQEMFERNDINETGCAGVASGELVSLDEFTYSNALMGCVIRWNLEQTSFAGVSVSA